MRLSLPRWIAALLVVPALISLAHVPSALAEDDPPAVPAARPAPEPDAKSIRAFISTVQEIAKAGATARLAQVFDIDEIVAYLEREGFFKLIPSDRRAEFVKRLRTGLATGLARPGVIDPFESFEIRGLKQGPRPGTAIVYVRMRDADGLLTKVRWHLRRDGASWRIYDVEDLDVGVRMMALVGGLLVDGLQGGGAGLRGASARFQQAQSLLGEGDFEAAYALLQEIEAQDLPDALAGLLQLGLAAASLGRAEFEEALDHAAQAEELCGDVPLLHYLRAVAYNLLDQPEQAYKHARIYIATIDEDPDVNLELGRALYGLDRRRDALAPLRKALAVEPVDYEALAYFALSLPTRERDEAAPYFAKLEDRAASLTDVAEICIAEERADVLTFFVDLYAKEDPRFHDVAYYRGQVALLRGQTKEAAVAFAGALERLKVVDMDPEEKVPYVEAWLDAMAALGQHVAAYEKADDKVFAFRHLAEDLSLGEDAAGLMDLVARAGKVEALLRDRRFYAADAKFLRREYAAVVPSLRTLRKELAALSEQDRTDEEEELLWEVEDRLVRSLVRMKGKALDDALDDALALAGEIAARDDDWDYVVLVRAHRGETKEALAALAKAIEDRDDAQRLFEDPDLAEILSSPAYADARATYLGK